MLTAKAAESDRVVGLELGADDYVTKPFSPRELTARVRALLRRTSPRREPPATIRHGDLAIDLGRREVTCGDTAVMLTATEFRLLHFLASRPGRVFSRNELIDNVLGQDVEVLDRTVDVHIMALRRKLGKLGDWIETVRGFGYRFRENEDSF
jgi:DNA-binding response OmpR family regulator